MPYHPNIPGCKKAVRLKNGHLNIQPWHKFTNRCYLIEPVTACLFGWFRHHVRGKTFRQWCCGLASWTLNHHWLMIHFNKLFKTVTKVTIIIILASIKPSWTTASVTKQIFPLWFRSSQVLSSSVMIFYAPGGGNAIRTHSSFGNWFTTE